jgi:hypothetical protein
VTRSYRSTRRSTVERKLTAFSTQGEISEKQAHAMLQEMEAKLKRATDGDYKTAHEVEQIAGKAGYPRLYPTPVT